MEAEDFKQLKTEFENGKILDFRDPANPNNKIAFICEYASNALPEGYFWSDNDRLNFANEHQAWDAGALETAICFAMELKCVLVHTLYTRLLIDTDKDLPSEKLFLKEVGDKVVEMNQGLTNEEELNRITKYYVTFYQALREVSEKVCPKYVVGVNSFPLDQKEDLKMFEIGIQFIDSEGFADSLYDGLREKGYNVEKNQPTLGASRNVIDTVLKANYPVVRKGVELDLRADVLQNEVKCFQVKNDILDVLRNLCEL